MSSEPELTRSLESGYAEDVYKLDRACNLFDYPDKDRKKIVSNFILSLKQRQQLLDETDRKFNNWSSELCNVHRQLNIVDLVPNERFIKILLDYTFRELLRIYIAIRMANLVLQASDPLRLPPQHF